VSANPITATASTKLLCSALAIPLKSAWFPAFVSNYLVQWQAAYARQLLHLCHILHCRLWSQSLLGYFFEIFWN